MTITTYTDREIKLQKELALEKQLAQLNGEIAAELKAERDTLRQQLAEALALIEASWKQEPVAFMTVDGRVSITKTVETAMPNAVKSSFNIPLFAAPVIADDVLKDAQRYRWLRDIPYTDEIRRIVSMQQNALFDTAINEAMGGAA